MYPVEDDPGTPPPSQSRLGDMESTWPVPGDPWWRSPVVLWFLVVVAAAHLVSWALDLDNTLIHSRQGVTVTQPRFQQQMARPPSIPTAGSTPGAGWYLTTPPFRAAAIGHREILSTHDTEVACKAARAVLQTKAEQLPSVSDLEHYDHDYAWKRWVVTTAARQSTCTLSNVVDLRAQLLQRPATP